MPDPMILAVAVWTSFAAVGLLAALLLSLRGTKSRCSTPFDALADALADLGRALGGRRE